jgi:hypothetical protein
MNENIPINQTCENCTKILEKVEKFKTEVTINMLWAINVEIFIMCNCISTALLTQWGHFFNIWTSFCN